MFVTICKHVYTFNKIYLFHVLYYCYFRRPISTVWPGRVRIHPIYLRLQTVRINVWQGMGDLSLETNVSLSGNDRQVQLQI